MKHEEKTRLTKEKIISAGIKEFGSKGYAAASINNVSNSGIAKGLIYHNFASKDELYIECLKICFKEITKALVCEGNFSDYKIYFDKRLKLLKEKREMAAMVLEALINPPQKHIDEIRRIREPYDKMNSEWIDKLLRNNKLRKNTDINSAMKYFSVMQDMFNWYCCNPKFENQSFERSISMNEKNLQFFFEYVLYGIVEEE